MSDTTVLAAFQWRILADRSYGRLVEALALLALFAVGGGLPAWAIGAGIAALMAALCAGETLLGQARVRPEDTPAVVRPASPGAGSAD